MMGELFTPLINNIHKTVVVEAAAGNNAAEPEVDFNCRFMEYLNKLEGFKTKGKNLHWAAPKKNVHEYLDSLISEIGEFQDGIAEDYMGINGQFQPNVLKGCESQALNAFDFINELSCATECFYNMIPECVCYAGIKSETETFIHTLNKYKYLFKLCDIKLY